MFGDEVRCQSSRPSASDESPPKRFNTFGEVARHGVCFVIHIRRIKKLNTPLDSLLPLHLGASHNICRFREPLTEFAVWSTESDSSHYIPDLSYSLYVYPEAFQGLFKRKKSFLYFREPSADRIRSDFVRNLTDVCLGEDSFVLTSLPRSVVWGDIISNRS